MKVKYPRTFHLPWSEALASDDRFIESIDALIGKPVIVTEKMDGENTTLYREHFHARSLDSRHHPSRDWVKGFWSSIRSDIPEGWRVCGENLYAEHSVAYSDLPSYFLGFSVWDEKNTCLDWNTTLEIFELLNVTPVPTLYAGAFDESTIKALWSPELASRSEGYVVRLASEFNYDAFSRCVAKFVRKGHVQSETHWMHQIVKPNRCRESTF